MPAGWWLVEFSPGQVATLSAEALQAQYERDVPLTSLDSFVDTVQDLRLADSQAAVRANALEDRIAALEATIASVREALSAAPQLTFPTING